MLLSEIKNESFRTQLHSFLSYLKEKGYKSSTLLIYQRTLSRIAPFMEQMGISEYSAAVGASYYKSYIENNKLKHGSERAILTQVLRFSNYCSGGSYCFLQVSTVDPVFSERTESILMDYRNYCYEKGNKPTTVNPKEKTIRKFLTCCSLPANTGLESLKPQDVTRACLSVSNKDDWAVIREFLRYLCRNSVTAADLSILVPCFRRPDPVPTVYSEAEIAVLESSIDRSRPSGKRNYAMILLATRLGLRSGDIVALSFENIDTVKDRIVLYQEKTGNRLELPLLPEIKEAISDYVDNGRPFSENRKIFLRSCAPYEPVTTSALRFQVRQGFHNAKIDTSGKKCGPHSLRSSLASSMVNDDIPYEVVRSVLGHSDPDAISHYARLSIEKLRKCALPVPAPTGNFLHFLKGGQ